jgi:hypothetical protein
MTKPTVIRLFVGSIVAVIAGLVLTFAAIWIAYASDVFVMNGPDVTGVHSSGIAWATVAMVVIGALGIIGGAIAGLISWIGALMNTAQLDDKTWFVLLLVLGLFSFGFIAMLAYVIGGPDGTQPRVANTAPAVS